MATQLLRIAVAASCFVCWACDDITSPTVDPSAVEMDFRSWVLGYGDPDGTAVNGGHRTLAVRASVRTGNCGYDFRPELKNEQGALEVVVRAQFGGGLTVVCHYRYELIMRGIPSGRHLVKVRHVNESERVDAVVFSGVVAVE